MPRSSPLRTVLSRPDLADPAFAATWDRDAERWGASPFLRWAWIGCLATARYPDPVLAEVHDGGTLIARALLNRRRTPVGPAYHLHESGDPAQDAIFIEHNGPLARPGCAPQALAAMLQALGSATARVVLSGIGDDLFAAAGSTGLLGPARTRAAPFLTLDAAIPLDAQLSRNTRSQLRRSQRSYAAWGPIVAERAGDAGVARDWLQRLTALHAASWAARGIASAFLAPAVQAFHQALLARGGAGVVRVGAGPRVIGYLLELRAGAHVCNYQGGFDYAGAAKHEKPGLTCHAAAADLARLELCQEYDFLAGDSRYKRSLANAARDLHWTTWQRTVSLPAIPALARRIIAG